MRVMTSPLFRKRRTTLATLYNATQAGVPTATSSNHLLAILTREKEKTQKKHRKPIRDGLESRRTVYAIRVTITTENLEKKRCNDTFSSKFLWNRRTRECISLIAYYCMLFSIVWLELDLMSGWLVK